MPSFLRAQTAILLCLLDMAAGMDYLHSLGILHADLKARCALSDERKGQTRTMGICGRLKARLPYAEGSWPAPARW